MACKQKWPEKILDENIKNQHVISQLQAGHCDQCFRNGILGREMKIMGRTTFKQRAMDKESDELID